jgi:hypothetical protein
MDACGSRCCQRPSTRHDEGRLVVRLRRPTSAPRRVVAVCAVTLLVVAAVWAGWLLRWLIAQRW